MIQLLLVDDHAIIRDGIRALLLSEPDIQVVGEASDGQELLTKLAGMSADLVLMDVNMPGMNGEEATRQVRQTYPQTQVLILSMLDHEEYIGRVIEAGASGYVLKNAGKDEIIFAIRSVANGRQFLSPELGFQLLHRMRATTIPSAVPDDITKKISALSRRELEILKLIAEGLTTGEIADKLYNSKRTIETHRQNMMEKARVKNTAALIRYAIIQGLIE